MPILPIPSCKETEDDQTLVKTIDAPLESAESVPSPLLLLHFSYLSFSEKFKRSLETSVVPVVYSAEGLHKVVPSHSYIDVRDFKSPKHLAEYLLYLDKNDDAYMAYFTWRKHFTCRGGKRFVNRVFCEFCQYLFEDKRPRILENFTKWFFEEAECKSFPKQL